MSLKRLCHYIFIIPFVFLYYYDRNWLIAFCTNSCYYYKSTTPRQAECALKGTLVCDPCGIRKAMYHGFMDADAYAWLIAHGNQIDIRGLTSNCALIIE